MPRFMISQFVLVLALLVLSACAPKDEKVSARAGRSGTGSFSDEPLLATGFPDRNDRSPEFARALLADVVTVSRKIEVVLNEIDRPLVTPSETVLAISGGGSAVSPNPLLAPCEAIQYDSVPSGGVGTIKFSVNSNQCEESGPEFNGKKRGTETFFAVLGGQGPVDAGGVSGQRVANLIRVETRGVERNLVPVQNKRDWISLKTFVFLEAELVNQTESVLTYKVKSETSAQFSLEIKAFSDSGSSSQDTKFFVDYDREKRRVSRVWTDVSYGQLELKIASARVPRGGKLTLRQEFRSTVDTNGQPLNFAMDLKSCSMPIGDLQTRFTIKSLARDADPKSFVLDQTRKFEAAVGEVRLVSGSVGSEAAGPKVTVNAETCTVEKAPSWTFGYQGLFY